MRITCPINCINLKKTLMIEYQIKRDNLLKRYNEALLKRTELTLKENRIVMKKLIIN